MTQPFNRRPQTAKDQDEFRVNLCEICGEQRGTETGRSSDTSVLPSTAFHQSSVLISIRSSLSPGQMDEQWEQFKRKLGRGGGTSSSVCRRLTVNTI
jgi:hypothetical protein